MTLLKITALEALVQLAYNLLALDQSSQTSGWSHFVDGELADFGKFTFSDADIGKRLCKVRDKIIELINQYNIDEVAFEDIQLQKDVQTFKVLAEVYGVVYQLCRELQIPCKSYLSTVWKSKIGIKGKDRGEQKRNAQKYVFERYGKKVTQDEADAVCIGICASIKEPEPFNWAQ